MLLTCLLPLACVGQAPLPAKASQPGCAQLLFISPAANCAQAAVLAQRDVQAHTPFLLLASGIAPVVFTTDSAFTQQFRVQYYEQGCSSAALACMLAYNYYVFDYLQATYGKAWQRKVRKDVVGLRQWQRQH